MNLDIAARNDKKEMNNGYVLKDNISPQIKEFMSGRNVYRKDESKIEAKIEKDKLNGIINAIEPRFQKLLMPTKLEDHVKEL